MFLSGWVNLKDYGWGIARYGIISVFVEIFNLGYLGDGGD